MHPHRVTSYTGQPKKDHGLLQNIPRRGSAASIPTNTSLLTPFAHPPTPPRRDSRAKRSIAVAGCSLHHILSKQREICRILDVSRCFHLWRRETLLLVEAMKTRSERTTALMLGGVDEESLDRMEMTRAKSSKLGISVMKWMLNSKHTSTMRRAWSVWRQAVAADKAVDTELAKLQRSNSELREKLSELKRNFKAKEELIRNGIVRGQMSNLMRIRMKASIRRRFDRWYRRTWEMKYDVEMRREKLKVDVGFQHIKSEREMVKETEIMSIQLKANLLCTLAFYQWKVKVKDDMIRMERSRWSDEKRAIQKELLLLRQGLLAINKREEQLVKAAKSRGMDVFSSLQAVGETMSSLSKMNSDCADTTKKTPTAPSRKRS